MRSCGTDGAAARVATAPQKFILRTAIPSLNAYVATERTNKFAAAALKKLTEKSLMGEMLAQQARPVSDYPATISYRLCAVNRRTDKSNIEATVKKFVEDALQGVGVLRGDGWNDLDYGVVSFEVDKDDPRVEVTIA